MSHPKIDFDKFLMCDRGDGKIYWAITQLRSPANLKILGRNERPPTVEWSQNSVVYQEDLSAMLQKIPSDRYTSSTARLLLRIMVGCTYIYLANSCSI